MPVTLDSRHHHGRLGVHEVETGDDDLMFGDFCFSCGNATQGTPYCSTECRESDSQQRSFLTPDFSPSLGPVPPPLISSAKSTSSTPPSSANNSPSPLSGLMGNLNVEEDPPRLDLPASASKFGQFGTAMPIGVRQPAGLTYGVTYTPELVVLPSKILKAASLGDAQASLEDLKYRRKPGVPATKAVPAPLYFRQSAAAAHSSPGLVPTPSPSLPPSTSPVLGPSSPSRPSFSPRLSAAKPIVSVANVSAFALPPPTKSAPSSPQHHPRRKSELVTHIPDIKPTIRRASWNSPADLLMSPRIRALRHEDTVAEGEEEDQTMQDEEAIDDEEQNHSAFAQYLFSHISETTTPTPSTSAVNATRSPPLPSTDEKRSISADSVLQVQGQSTSRGRTTRFLFGRGAAAGKVDRDEAEESVDEDKTPMRPRLTPGGFISATVGTPMSSTNASPFPSPPPSPPTAQRGRSHTRRPSDVSMAPLSEVDPRGRSKLRGLGAVKRSQSPHRDSSQSVSRGRQTETSSERGRQASRSSARSERSETRNRVGSPSRGRGRRSDLRDEVIPGSVDDEGGFGDDEEERGRRGRSRSLLRRGRGREVAISGAGYGHYESP